MDRPRADVHPVSRLALPDVSRLPAPVRRLLADETEQFGAPLNPTMVWAHNPALLLAYRTWRKAMNEATLTPEVLKYLVYVRVARLNGCPF